MVVQFLSRLIRHIKHVGHLIQTRRNPRGMDRQPDLKDRVRDDVQQSLTVVGKHIDDRKRVGGFVVNPHLRRLGSLWKRSGRLQPGATPDHVIDMFPAFQYGGDAVTHRLPSFDRWFSAVIGIGDLKGVNYDAIGSRQNLGVENLQPATGHDTGNFGEDARSEVIAGDDRIFTDAQLAIEVGLYNDFSRVKASDG